MDETKWHLDRRIPLPLIFALALQTIGLVMWGTKLEQRVQYLEQGQVTVEPYGERLARIEVMLDQVVRAQETARAAD